MQMFLIYLSMMLGSIALTLFITRFFFMKNPKMYKLLRNRALIIFICALFLFTAGDYVKTSMMKDETNTYYQKHLLYQDMSPRQQENVSMTILGAKDLKDYDKYKAAIHYYFDQIYKDYTQEQKQALKKELEILP